MALKRVADTVPFGLTDEIQWVGGRGGAWEARNASVGGSASSADLGGSSKYSSEILEGRSGEGFHANIDWTWVSRS